MATLAEILYTDGDTATLSSCIYGVSSLAAAVEFANTTAEFRTVPCVAVRWSSNAIVQYDRSQYPARKRIDWLEPYTEETTLDDHSSLPGNPLYCLACLKVRDPAKAISKRGWRHFTIPGYIDAIPLVLPFLCLTFARLFEHPDEPEIFLQQTRYFSRR